MDSQHHLYDDLVCCDTKEVALHRYHQLALTALLYSTASIGFSRPSQELKRKAIETDFQVTRLAPSAFPELPANIRRELERRGCTIPQVRTDKKPQNVIKGAFTRTGQTDWAVLCSVNQVSTILVFRNASERNPSELERETDIDNLQAVGGDRSAYSRSISSVGREYILSHYRAYGGPEQPTIGHQGISDAFVGKGSVVHYFHAGRWVKLTGAD
jgi:hypothetical protein